jgi:hypothetical protein
LHDIRSVERGMPEPRSSRYVGFLSYSHRDRDIGEKLHSELESFTVPKGLTGKFGSLPEKLAPIFRDRFDLEAGHSLRNQVVEALQDSGALIVLCSPASAKSKYVGEEIRLFKSMGKADRVFPIIIDGEPGDALRECFPSMLRHKIAPDGSVLEGEQEDEPIAADMRETGDGPELAKVKLIAGLLGVDVDEIRKREELRRKQQLKRTRLVAGAMSALALVAIGFAFYAWNLNGRLEAALLNETTAKQQAESNYREALQNNLKLVSLAATFRTLKDPTQSFGVREVNAKLANESFGRYLRNSSNSDEEIWFPLARVLREFARDLPPELEPFSTELEKNSMRKQWLIHAEVIMSGVASRHPTRADYRSEHNSIRSELGALGFAAETNAAQSRETDCAQTSSPEGRTAAQMAQMRLPCDQPLNAKR